ncbi:MAG: glycosyltransferase family 4 protein [Sphingomonadales bacterium]|nr:glycosyltransferase family 4 protein [Sphingomonadales bacterium]
MHLLINGRFLSRPLSGVDRTAQELIRALVAQQPGRPLQIDCAVPRDAPEDATIRQRLTLPATSRIHRSSWRGYAFEQLALARIAPQAMLLSLCNIGPVARQRQLILIHDAQVHDAPESYTPAFRAAYALLQPRLARRARHVATVSDHSRRRLLANGIGRPGSIAVIANGVDHLDRVAPDHSIIERLRLEAQSYVLALTHPAPHKNLALLHRVYPTGDPSLPPLVLVGPRSNEPGDDRIRYTGRISDGELKALYAGARMFLFPSLTEGFGFPALEAMTCGCPVIAARAGAIPEVVGDAAILLDPHNADGWLSAIIALSQDATARDALTRAGRQRAARFTWDRAARQVLDLLGAGATAASDPASCRQSVPA